MHLEIDIAETVQMIATLVLWVIILRAWLERWKHETLTRKALIPALSMLIAIPIGFLLSVFVTIATYDDSKAHLTPRQYGS